MTDYLDVDVAYLLGLIAARGTVTSSGGSYQLVLEFPYSYVATAHVKEKNALLVSLNKVSNRISELVSTPFQLHDMDNHAELITREPKNTIFWRDLKLLMGDSSSYNTFRISSYVFEATNDIKKEFIRGYADVAGSIRESNYYTDGRHRVYIDILNPNWKLPVEICRLLQIALKIPIQTLTWGHPNLRNTPKEKWSRREHQLKIFAEDFRKIGFYIQHKEDELNRLANLNKKKRKKTTPCNPPKKIRGKNPHHPDEKDAAMPIEIRGKHYDSYWQICGDLGCLKMKNQTKITKSRRKSKK